jgi:hypothetical protein
MIQEQDEDLIDIQYYIFWIARATTLPQKEFFAEAKSVFSGFEAVTNGISPVLLTSFDSVDSIEFDTNIEILE